MFTKKKKHYKSQWIINYQDQQIYESHLQQILQIKMHTSYTIQNTNALLVSLVPYTNLSTKW